MFSGLLRRVCGQPHSSSWCLWSGRCFQDERQAAWRTGNFLPQVRSASSRNVSVIVLCFIVSRSGYCLKQFDTVQYKQENTIKGICSFYILGSAEKDLKPLKHTNKDTNMSASIIFTLLSKVHLKVYNLSLSLAGWPFIFLPMTLWKTWAKYITTLCCGGICHHYYF